MALVVRKREIYEVGRAEVEMLRITESMNVKTDEGVINLSFDVVKAMAELIDRPG